jgi:ribosomal protein L30E
VDFLKNIKNLFLVIYKNTEVSSKRKINYFEELVRVPVSFDPSSKLPTTGGVFMVALFQKQ